MWTLVLVSCFYITEAENLARWGAVDSAGAIDDSAMPTDDSGDTQPDDSGDTQPDDTADTQPDDTDCKLVYYEDGDGDGFGGDDAAQTFCEDPGKGWLTTAGDCNDADAAVHPGADELCGGEDEDCDGQEDVDAVDQVYWFRDEDGDGFGSEDWCYPDEGQNLNNDDCEASCADPDPEDLLEHAYVDNNDDCCDYTSSVGEGCLDQRDGSFEGAVTLTWVSTTEGTDTCTGSMSATVDHDGAKGFSGNGECTFTGALAKTVGSPVAFSFGGEVSVEKLLGSMTVLDTEMALEAEWQDGGYDYCTYDGSTTGSEYHGTVEFSGEWKSSDLDVEGTFTLSP